ncbi:MAG: DUF3883 domain-containing protein [Pseudolysinimonas sp.]|uniref:DUF3883 domain-containing protein n=1 Tax=Pseudolysinimonas sp. TaxID=2680009 RepID=UPI00326358D8
MSAVTALKYLREFASANSESVAEAVLHVPFLDVVRAAHDYEAAVRLDAVVDSSNLLLNFESDIRRLVTDLLEADPPGWLQVVPLGRERVASQLEPDVLQVLRAGGLFDPVPSVEAIEWWDQLAARARGDLDARRLELGRDAERRSLEYELDRLSQIGCPYLPRWLSLDDNSAGYDIQSWEVDDGVWRQLAIEVKSTVSSIVRFHLSRGEYETCVKLAGAYRFHTWVQGNGPIIVESQDVIASAPLDGTGSRWETAEFVFAD